MVCVLASLAVPGCGLNGQAVLQQCRAFPSYNMPLGNKNFAKNFQEKALEK